MADPYETEARNWLYRADRDIEERKTLWRALSAYDMCDGYLDFCSYLGMRLGRRSELFYDTLHACYALAWKTYGWDQLQRMIRIGWNGLYLHDGRLA